MNDMDGLIRSDNLKSMLSRYINKITEFYKYGNDQYSLSELLRHVEIVRVQISEDLSLISNLDNLESEFIHSILSDSYYFEKNKSESKEWKASMLKIIWANLLNELGVDTSKYDISNIHKGLYADLSRTDGRYVYKRYNE